MLCLATDLGMGFPFEHGLHSTLFAMRLGERLGVDSETAAQIYYGCLLLLYVGCTADAEITAELFEEGALLTYFAPVMFGARAERERWPVRGARLPCVPSRPRAGSPGLFVNIGATSTPCARWRRC